MTKKIIILLLVSGWIVSYAQIGNLESQGSIDFYIHEEVTNANGENISDFRYVIGGLLMKNIYEKEGVKGLVESLEYGTSDEDFHELLKAKLGISKNEFDEYIKEQMKKYTE